MDPTAQRIAIAESRGYTEIRMSGRWECSDDSSNPADWCGLLTPVYGHIRSYLPDYLGNLNAIHEAEETLNRHQRSLFRGHLGEMFPRDEDGDTTGWEGRFGRAIHATAAQRAEAFLCAIGKWQDAA